MNIFYFFVDILYEQYYLGNKSVNRGGNRMALRMGKIMKKIRIDHDEVLADMAKKLKISTSYLSAMETGKRAFPKDFFTGLRKFYAVPDEVMTELVEAAAEGSLKVEVALTAEQSAVLNRLALAELEPKPRPNYDKLRMELVEKRNAVLTRLAIKALRK